MILSAWLIAASFIDLAHQWLPDLFTQGVLWTGPVLLPDVALVASLCGLIYAVSTGKQAKTLPFGPFLSLGGMVTLYAQALM